MKSTLRRKIAAQKACSATPYQEYPECAADSFGADCRTSACSYRGVALFETEHLRQMSDEDLARLLRWAITEGELAGAVQPRLARLYGILAADLRFELWLRAQSVRGQEASSQTQRAPAPGTRGVQIH